MLGYLFAILAMVSFGLLGIFHKLADRQKCTPFVITVVLFSSSTIVMGGWVLFFAESNFSPPSTVIWVAIPFGLATVISIWVFQYGIRFGKITTSWVIINLSAAVPTVASTIIYDEALGFKKSLILVLIVLAILLLWKDMQVEKSQAKQSTLATPVMGESEELPGGK